MIVVPVDKQQFKPLPGKLAHGPNPSEPHPDNDDPFHGILPVEDTPYPPCCNLDAA